MKNIGVKFRLLKDEFIRNFKDYIWILLFLVIYLVYFRIFHYHESNCLIKRAIGYPCPGCGMSRAIFYFLTFQFKTAFLYHPFVFALPFISFILFVKRLKYIKNIYNSKTFWIILTIVFIGIYIIRMHFYFPDTVPLDYYEDSLLNRLFH